MERIKKARIGQRGAFTKLYNNLRELLSASKPDMVELEVYIRILDQRINSIRELDQQMYDHLLNISSNEDDIVTELETTEEYLTKYNFIKVSYETMLNKRISDKTGVKSISGDIVRGQNKLNLPKIEFKKFGGDVKDWLSFWSQFRRIHEDQEIDEEDKFQYLIQATAPRTRARQVVDSFPPTSNNYYKAIDSLTSRFGRQDLLIEVYVRELLSLILNNLNREVKLSELYDKMETQLRALDTLGVTSDTCAAMLFPLVESCLPEEFLRAWQRSSLYNCDSSLKDRLNNIMKFLRREVESEERILMAASGFNIKGGNDKLKKKRDMFIQEESVATASGLINQKSSPKCVFCNGFHSNAECTNAKKFSYEEKMRILKEKKCCFICLKFGHISRNCHVRIHCNICNKRHVNLMCPEIDKKDNKVYENKKQIDLPPSETLSNSTRCEVFLLTLKVKIIGPNNNYQYVRAIVDTGSQRSYISKSLASTMQCVPLGEDVIMHALFGGVYSENIKHIRYRIWLNSVNDSYSCNFEVLDQEVICNSINHVKEGPWIKELENLGIEISDRNPEPVNILIGADVAGKLLTGKNYKLDCGLVAIETLLGWTLMGKVLSGSLSNNMIVTSLFSAYQDISDLWSLETLGIKDPAEKKTREQVEAAVRKHFLETVSINSEGRFEVNMPWLQGHPPLPTYEDIARKRLETVTGKLKREGYFDDYRQVFREWLQEHIIEEVPAKDLAETKGHYLPHRHVVKLSSKTTKIRPVFDALVHQKNQPSLNQCLDKGLNLIELIPIIMIRFRLQRYGLVSDIRRAFLQISLSHYDRDFLRFFWYGEDDEIKIYRHARVVFGATCSPFLLCAVIDHHLKRKMKETIDHLSPFTPWIISKLAKSFYVDNCVTSVDSIEDVYQFIKESSDMMSDGMFDLRCWEHTRIDQYEDDVEDVIPVLGLNWNKREDTLLINNDCFKDNITNVVTKRKILSYAQHIFDPIGFSCPVSLYPKMLLQKIWKMKIGWDVEVQDDIKTEFLRWLNELSCLKRLTIPRWLNISPQSENLSFHVFCDACQDAYACVIFLRSIIDTTVHVHLLQAKARVSPIRKVTIPRLELMAATIGARLSQAVKENLDRNLSIYWWTDSTTVLSWIKREEIWKPFVWNRVEEIRRLTNKHFWQYVPGELNPADLPSRGCSPKVLLKSNWWLGPAWLYESEENWPSQEFLCNEDLVYTEKRSEIMSLFNDKLAGNWYYRYFSKFEKIVRLIAWINRFIYNCRNRKNKRIGSLDVEEVLTAETKLFQLIQRECFGNIKHEKLSTLCPFIDDQGIIRLRTKISERTDDEEFRFPIVLSPQHIVVKRLIYDQHVKMSHVGIQGLLSVLREKFWIVTGRRAVKSIINKCVVCRRFETKMLNTPPVALPKDRVDNASTFEITGVDFAGPLFLKNGEKVWICIFTCGIYRAIHLELVTSLSTEVFLQALRRFIDRRGRPRIIYSDNGTNFVGAENMFEKLDWKVISEYSTIQRIRWKFNPVTAAWWGGWWERLVRLVKQLLRKTLGKSSLNFEELSTVICDCESIINSRPLTYLSESSDDLIALTPNMFLHDLDKTTDISDIDKIDSSHFRKHIRYRQTLRDALKERFRSEYLGQLILYSKTKTHKVKKGDLVFIGHDNMKRIDWPLAIVEEEINGKDGEIRLLRLKTKSGHILRPLQRVFPLEVEANDIPLLGSSNINKAQTSISSKNATVTSDSKTDKTRSGRTVKRPQRYGLSQ